MTLTITQKMPYTFYYPPKIEIIETMVEAGFESSMQSDISIPGFEEGVWD